MNGVQSNLSLYKETNFNWVHSTLLNDRIDAKNYKVEYLELQRKIISQTYIRLRDVIEDIKNGFEVNRSYSDVGLKFLTVKDLKEFEINYSDIKKIDLHFRDTPEKGRLKEGDIIITRSGSIGIAKTITNNDEDIVISSHIIKLRVNNKIDRDYLTTYLNSDTGRKLIEQLSYGAVIKEIGQEELLDLLIPIPSPEIQKYIGDKVRKAEELREEAKRLKKDAEEIFYEAIEIDKLNSKLIKVTKFSWIKENQIEDRLDLKYNSPSIITIYEHFRKYKCSLLKDEFKTISGYAFSSGDFDDMDGEKVIKIGDISDFTIDTTSLTRVKIGTKVKERIREFSCNIQDLVYAMTGATIGKVAMYIDNETVYINQRVACIKPKRNNIPTGYLLLYLNSDIGKEISYSLSTGVAQPNIALEELNNIVIPQLANNIMDKIHHNVLNSLIKHKESKQLIQEAKQDVEDLIEGNFDMSKVKANS